MNRLTIICQCFIIVILYGLWEVSAGPNKLIERCYLLKEGSTVKNAGRSDASTNRSSERLKSRSSSRKSTRSGELKSRFDIDWKKTNYICRNKNEYILASKVDEVIGYKIESGKLEVIFLEDYSVKLFVKELQTEDWKTLIASFVSSEDIEDFYSQLNKKQIREMNNSTGITKLKIFSSATSTSKKRSRSSTVIEKPKVYYERSRKKNLTVFTIKSEETDSENNPVEKILLVFSNEDFKLSEVEKKHFTLHILTKDFMFCFEKEEQAEAFHEEFKTFTKNQ